MRPSIAAVLLIWPRCWSRAPPATTTTCCCAGLPPPDTRAAPRLAPAARNDGEASYVRHLLANGFGAELLRTYAMTKRFAAETSSYRARDDDDRARRARRCRRARPARARSQIGWWPRRSRPPSRSSGSTTAGRAGSAARMVDLVSGFGGAIADVDRARDRRALRAVVGAARRLHRVPPGRRGRMAAAARHRRSRRPAAAARRSRTFAPTTPC